MKTKEEVEVIMEMEMIMKEILKITALEIQAVFKHFGISRFRKSMVMSMKCSALMSVISDALTAKETRKTEMKRMEVIIENSDKIIIS